MAEDYPDCDWEHVNIAVLRGVTVMPIEDLPKVCSCGRPLTYADEVCFVSEPEYIGEFPGVTEGILSVTELPLHIKEES